MLVRLDPDKNAIALMSIPRDLRSTIPGYGRRTRSTPPTRTAAARLTRQDGQAAALDAGAAVPDQPRHDRRLHRLPQGGRLRRLRLRRHRPALLQRPRRPGRLRDDRHPARLPEDLRARTRSTTCAIATRTTTSCAPPASRTSCARCATRRGSRKLMSFGTRRTASWRGSSRATRHRQGLHSQEASCFACAKLGDLHRRRTRSARCVPRSSLGAGRHQPRAPRTAAAAVGRRVPRGEGLRRTRAARATAPREPAQAAAARRRASAASIEARGAGENLAIIGTGKVDFPFYFPRLRTTGRRYSGEMPRIYKIQRRARQEAPAPTAWSSRTQARRRVLRHPGHELAYPPILDDPHRDVKRNGRELMRLLRRAQRPARRLAHQARPSTGWRTRSPSRSRARR